MKIEKHKKGEGALDALQNLAIGIAGFVIAIVVAFLIASEGESRAIDIEGACNGSVGGYACNASKDLQTELDTLPGWIGIIIVAVVGVALLGLIRLFQSRRR